MQDSNLRIQEEFLLNYVLENNVSELKKLIQENSLLLTKELVEPPYYMPILYVACKEECVNKETIKCLLDNGADPCQELTEESGRHAIHIAAEATRSEVISLLMENDNGKQQIKCLDKEDNSALLILMKEGNKSNLEEFMTCVDIMIRNRVNVNQTDSKGRTAILIAAYENYRDVLQQLLKCKAIDIDTHHWQGKSAREMIIEKKLAELETELRPCQDNRSDKEILFQFIKEGKQAAFLDYKRGDIKEHANAESAESNNTLLQLSCKKGFYQIVKHLLNNEAIYDKISKNTKGPIEIAAECNNYDIVQLLLGYYPKDVKVPVSVLISLIQIQKELPNGTRYNDLFKQLVTKTDLNCVDQHENSPLHYAVRYADCGQILRLLDNGASLLNINKYQVYPLKDIDPQVLKKHLDNCFSFDLKAQTVKKVNISFKTLLPPQKDTTNTIDKVEEGSQPKRFDCTSLLLTANSANFDNYCNETKAIAYMASAPEFKHLLGHPLVVIFLLTKWLQVKRIFYINITLYTFFSVFIFSYIFISYGKFRYIHTQANLNGFITISQAGVIAGYIYLICRESFQIAMSPKKYFRHYDNYLEIALILIVSAILFIPEPSKSTCKQLSAIAILLVAFDFILMLTPHPKLSVEIVMLQKVSFTFFKFLLFYSLLILAFAFCFYTLFETGDEENFARPGDSLFKTIIMLTGEFDSASIDFELYPVISRVIFIIFILLICLVLLNLLNGLAVSDTQQILDEAELIGHISCAKYIYYIESFNHRKNVFGKLLIVLLRCFHWQDDSLRQSVFHLVPRRESGNTSFRLHAAVTWILKDGANMHEVLSRKVSKQINDILMRGTKTPEKQERIDKIIAFCESLKCLDNQ